MSVDPLLRQKFLQAANAILKNHALLICSGSGMTAECKIQPSSIDRNHKNHESRVLHLLNGLSAPGPRET